MSHEATRDRQIDEVLGGERGAYATGRFDQQLTGWGGLAFDGDPATGWRPSPGAEQRLTLRFPAQTVTSVTIHADNGAGLASPTSGSLVIGDGQRPVAFQPDPTCSAREDCDVVAAVSLPGLVADHLDLGLRPTALVEGQPVEITEVELNGQTNPAGDQSLTGCTTGQVSVDGQPLALRIQGSVSSVLGGRPTEFESCGPLALDDGWHLLETPSPSPVSDLRIDTLPTSVEAAPTTTEDAQLLARSDDGMTARISGEGEAVIVTGQSWDPGWHASVNGVDLGPPYPVNGLTGWTTDLTGEAIVEFTFRPAQTFRIALLITGVGLVLCIGLILRRSQE